MRNDTVAAVDDVTAEVGARVRELRVERGLSLSALARSAGLGKATLSALESGQRNPTLATLFALTTALGLPLSAALAVGAPSVSGEAVDAWLVERAAPADVFRLRVRAGAHQLSAPHAAGVTEQVLVVRGRLRCGADPVELGPGGSTTYDGGRAHLWQALDGADVSAVLVMRDP